MAKTQQILFDFKEIVTALVKKEGIHEGLWMLYVEFGLAAVNAPILPEGQKGLKPPEDLLTLLMPTAILPIKKIGIQRAQQLSNLAVDAGKVNPKPKPKSRKN